MSNGFWDGQGANIASRYKKLYGVKGVSPFKAVSLGIQ